MRPHRADHREGFRSSDNVAVLEMEPNVRAWGVVVACDGVEVRAFCQGRQIPALLRSPIIAHICVTASAKTYAQRQAVPAL